VSEVHPITFRLKVFNAWRRGNNAPQPDPKTVGEDIDSICDLARRLERERDEAREERNQYKSLLIRLYNDLFVHHKGEAVREFKELFREENYN
jgi:hypothetical protein